MTQLMQQVFEKATKLPADAQDAIAARVLEEMEDESQWDEAFARSQGQLKRLADKVRAEIRAGKVRDISPEQL